MSTHADLKFEEGGKTREAGVAEETYATFPASM